MLPAAGGAIGAGAGVLIGHRLPERTRTTVTDALGLVTIVVGALNLSALGDDAFGYELLGVDFESRRMAPDLLASVRESSQVDTAVRLHLFAG
jgi:hypothetical protein